MTYNVFGGTLNPTLLWHKFNFAIARYVFPVSIKVFVVCLRYRISLGMSMMSSVSE